MNSMRSTARLRLGFKQLDFISITRHERRSRSLQASLFSECLKNTSSNSSLYDIYEHTSTHLSLYVKWYRIKAHHITPHHTHTHMYISVHYTPLHIIIHNYIYIVYITHKYIFVCIYMCICHIKSVTRTSPHFDLARVSPGRSYQSKVRRPPCTASSRNGDGVSMFEFGEIDIEIYWTYSTQILFGLVN